MAEGQGRGPTSFLPRDIHEITVTGLEVLDLTTEEALERVGLSPSSIRAAAWGPCQRVGEAAHFLGFQGILAPSATGMGSVLAVFEPRLRRGQLVLARTETLRLDA
jgi:RES domain-containing protein